ncbi:hypothetical protein MPTK1_7g16150 [Marchantia polymorpha subsp. ruderalis]|nr:hypothetical protein MARPO_0111s0005 [Marchantia polymorpha]BBN17664.1 hypothetical protein Mp_7g16150 [Marchantia polymorpha subsp. ruderalis]|eukprot:PTQ31444.1 hypothetical protein MARPO_0111s0005 [Marchantia polymorpha]
MPKQKPVKYTSFPRGVLRLGVGCARGIRGDELLGLGRSDPYAKITFGSQENPLECTTKTDKNAGSNPYWGEWFTMPITVPNVVENNNLVVQIYNENHLRSDNQIGYSRIHNLGELVMGCEKYSTGEVWHIVYDPGTQLPRGEIMLSFRFEPMGDVEFEKWVNDQVTALTFQQPPTQASGYSHHLGMALTALRLSRAGRLGVGA